MAHFVVTGGAGFIGANLVRYLADKYPDDRIIILDLLTYAGSLATLLWRRILHQHDTEVDLSEFSLLGLLTVPVAVALAVMALWVALQLFGG